MEPATTVTHGGTSKGRRRSKLEAEGVFDGEARHGFRSPRRLDHNLQFAVVRYFRFLLFRLVLGPDS